MYPLTMTSSLTKKVLIATFFAVVALFFFPTDALAQTAPTLPGLDAIDTDSDDPAQVLIIVAKYVVGIILWLAVLFLAVKTIFEAIKDIKDAKDGDTKWAAAGKSIGGGVLFFIFILAMALWITNMFLN